MKLVTKSHSHTTLDGQKLNTGIYITSLSILMSVSRKLLFCFPYYSPQILSPIRRGWGSDSRKKFKWVKTRRKVHNFFLLSIISFPLLLQIFCIDMKPFLSPRSGKPWPVQRNSNSMPKIKSCPLLVAKSQNILSRRVSCDIFTPSCRLLCGNRWLIQLGIYYLLYNERILFIMRTKVFQGTWMIT